MSTKKYRIATTPVRVEIDEAQFWTLARQHPVHMGVSVTLELRKAGIPIECDVGLRAVTHGRLTISNEYRDGKRLCIYEWTPPAPDEEEL